ncbi:MAG: hypothetical protein JST84_30405 [Acidobacteria bacterium]|nr:hypothetical protein [Acidobacteriota bacterium]
MRNRQITRSTVFSFLLLCLLFTLPASSHDPITTSVTFNKEVIRILQRNCLGCHAPGKIKNDIPLTTYEEARPWAKAIKEEVLEKRMPPYQAMIGYGEFQNPYMLPKRDLELLISWVEGGAPRGDAKELPKELVPAANWSFGTPELNLQPDEMVTIPAGEGLYEACVKLPTTFKQDQWARAIEFIPGQASSVLGAEFYLQKQCGGNCSGGEKIGEWVPGQATTMLPDNTGILLPANGCLTMKIQYRKGEQEIKDHSILGVYRAKDQVTQQAQRVMIKPLPRTVPAGAKLQRVKASYVVQDNAQAVSIRPLLFPLAKSIEATAFYPDGTVEVLIAAKEYRHTWQPSYFYKRPVRLPAKTRIEVTAYFDNSDQNPNLSDDPKPKKIGDPLIELTLAKPGSTKSSTARN